MSYIWGVVIFQDGVSSIGLSVCGVILLLLGVIVIAQHRAISQKIFREERSVSSKSSADLTAALRASDIELSCDPERSYSTFSNKASPAESGAARVEAVGMGWALVVGLAGGSVLAPEHYASPKESGLAFLPSFGLGTIIASPLLTLVWFTYVEKTAPVWQIETIPVGLFSGLLWNISNVFAIMAIPSIGYGEVAFF